jgi:hypothetical protein
LSRLKPSASAGVAEARVILSLVSLSWLAKLTQHLLT